MACPSVRLQALLLILAISQMSVRCENEVKSDPCDNQDPEVAQFIKREGMEKQFQFRPETDPTDIYQNVKGCLTDFLIPKNATIGWPKVQGKRRKRSSRRKRAIHINVSEFNSTMWPSRTIGYKFATGFNELDDTQKYLIKLAMQKWQAETCLRFTEIPGTTETEDNHVIITKGTGCITFVGRAEIIPQPLYLAASCFDVFGRLLHEIGHVGGLWHEHQRPDRDKFIEVVYEYVRDYEMANLMKIPPELIEVELVPLQPFDYHSLMAYHPKAFAIDRQTTIKTIDNLYQRTIGQRSEIGFNDAKLVNSIYCSNVCQKATDQPCQNSGYQNPNDCERCKCPDGFTGQFCQYLQDRDDYKNEICGGNLTATSDPQEVESPGYDTSIRGYYLNDQYCVWNIKAPHESMKVHIQIDQDFGIYCSEHKSCQHWLEIKYLKDKTIAGPRWCCNDLHEETITSEGHTVQVIFKAMSHEKVLADQRRGFKFYYSAVPAASSCGACNLKAGQVQHPCEDASQKETIRVPVCKNVYKTDDRTGLTRIEKVYETVERTVNRKYCCDNAVLINAGAMRMCGVPGWTDWSPCDAPCGACGRNIRHKYEQRSYSENDVTYTVLKMVTPETRPCNIKACAWDDCFDFGIWPCYSCCYPYKNNKGICEQ